MSWLTKLFGFDALAEAKNEEIIYLYEQIQYLQSREVDKEIEIQRLTNIILTEHGVIPREDNQPDAKSFHPVPVNRRPNWRTMQKQMERQDANLASQISKTVEDYWQNKNAQSEAEK